MNHGKAAGNDGIVGEMLKISKYVLIPHLFILFNNILESGIYPNGWCETILCPLHKNGSVNEVGNYRGISILPVLSKVFTKILNNRLRLVKWAETTICKKKSKLVIEKITLQLIKYLAYKRCVKNIFQKRRENCMLFLLTLPKLLIPYLIICCGIS